jgi:hypothetical protein
MAVEKDKITVKKFYRRPVSKVFVISLKKHLMQHALLKQLRFIGILEGISYLVLLFIAMPLCGAFALAPR